VLSRIAHAAKAHWEYPEVLLRLWQHDLTVTPRFIEEHDVFCARRDGRIAGFYALSRDGSTFELEHLWVDPDDLGRGIGACLFRHAVDRVRECGGDVLRIASDPHAEGFYRRMGARRVDEVASTPAGRMLPLLDLDVTRRDRAGTRDASPATPPRPASTPRSSC
jgi:GNAT superfamily N-acetyltransferase